MSSSGASEAQDSYLRVGYRGEGVDARLALAVQAEGDTPDQRDLQIAALEAQVDALIRAALPFARAALLVRAKDHSHTLVRIEVQAGQLRRIAETVEGIRPGAVAHIRPVPR